MNRLISLALGSVLVAGVAAGPALSQQLSLSYFMGPAHPMNAAVFTPFAEKLAEVSGGKMSIQQFPAGALNSAPPRQYSILIDGVADVAFALPGYTSQLFPMTNVITVPTVCASAVACTDALIGAKDTLEGEYNAKVLAIWANDPPVLMTRNKPVRALEDLAGMTVRVTSAQDVPFMEALGASAVSQPVNVINQNLSNGVIDAIAIDPSAFLSFALYEPANYVTVGIPGSGSAFVLLMNNGVFDALSEEEQGWINEASGDWLSRSGGQMYGRIAQRGIDVAVENGVELIELSAEERQRFLDAIAGEMAAFKAKELAPGVTGADMMAMMGAGS
ncbi:MAG: TRAP transporter substrate-binding protein [Alphaproteobacteria bacterium]|nr:TRAP transporter substrate-binding protein [Alphaproteobacteria bacterium]